MIKAVIFDCFGVIYNHAVRIAFDTLGGSQLDDTDFYYHALKMHSMGLIGRDEMDHMIAKGLNVSYEEWVEASDESRGRDERMMKLIAKTKKSYKTALLSNIGSGQVDIYFPGSEQEEYFDAVIASSEVGIVKPDRTIYELALKKLGVEANEAIFIDDNPGFVEAAAELGIHGIRFESYTELTAELAGILDA